MNALVVRLLALVLVVVGCLAAPAVAPAASDLRSPPSLDQRAVGYDRTAREVLRIADRLPAIKEERGKYRRSTRSAFLKSFRKWQISYYDTPKRKKEIGQVQIDDASGAVLETWTGYKVPWSMARGYDGAFGRKVNSPWVWIPLAILFVLPFVDLRRVRRWLHLDLLALSGFSVAYAFFNAGEIDTATPITAALLLYFFVRMVCVGLRPRDTDRPPDGPLPLLVPALWLGVATIFLLGFRLGLNLMDSNVIDVGYAGVIGADKLGDGMPLYGNFPEDNGSGDTYGPILYLLYVPFELLLPWSGGWADLHAAHAAALTFDLLTVALLYVLGRQLRGSGMGIAFAFAWVAFPFTTFASNTNANDALPALFTIAALIAATSPQSRGVLVGLAGLTKLAQLGLIPLFATHRWSADRQRIVTLYALGLSVPLILGAAIVLLNGGSMREFYDASLAFQGERLSPFTVWGLYESIQPAQIVAQMLGVGFGVAVAFLPRRHDTIGLAALAAAVLLALQLGLGYWFFLYVVWWAPLVMIALLGRYSEPAMR